MDCRHDEGGKALFSASDYISGEEFAVRECSQCCLVYTDLSSTEQAVIGETFYLADYYGQQKRYPLFLGKILNSSQAAQAPTVTRRVHGAVWAAARIHLR
jgi:hypothetical protein